ncbi:HMG-Y-related protein A [Hibiscus syriacus]|uniref:HMG-Y-related protein A n=2 Tax=Hibiscus syriacus TaxID=106335 RepID=A0A6A2XPC7_HIBSY|nr:HMG-Y-related protein B-like isoform X1 [Hibiscus syriacus]KAE8663876.1 HMG-Y-related protein A [Hibiscus syriacus]
MATEESNHTRGIHASQQSSLPDYTQMIMETIEALNEKDGSNMASITKHIELTHSDLPENHYTLLSHHLNLMKQSGELVMSNDNYMKPDPNGPPKRGRGRPPKPKSPLPPDAVVSSPRPRGRPPKPRDLSAPPKPKTPVSTGRPRGRPPKKAKTTATVTAPPPPPGVKRGRGRPPKVQPLVVSQ